MSTDQIDVSQLEDLKEDLKQVEKKAKEIRSNAVEKVSSEIDLANSDIDVEDLQEFMKKPYLVNELGDDKYQIIVPEFIDFQVGRLDKQVNNYNVFVVDKYTKWLHGVPEFLKDEIEMDDEQNVKVFEDHIEFEEEAEDVVDDVSDKLENIRDGKATIKQGSEFDLIADLIEKGELPFTSQPVQKEDMREPEVNFDLWEHQQEGFDEWMSEGAVCFCWMTSAGKSFPSMMALDSLKYDSEKSKKAVVTNSRSSKQQWERYFEEFAPRLLDEVEIVTYHSIDKLEGDYVLVVFDECHYLPADTFAKGSTIPMKYRIGLSASPYREDDRENYIFALTGKPVGLDWEKTLDLMDKTRHNIEISISKSKDQKIRSVKNVFDEVQDKKTLIFCDSLDLGDQLSEELGVDFVSGRDNKQLKLIRESLEEDYAVIVSRIADHGLSFDDLEVILEVDFLFGSRRQQIQRTGRLFHGEGKRHVIFFTGGEFNKYEKRLYSLIEKGFDLEFIDQDIELDVPEKYESNVDLDIEVEESSEGSGVNNNMDDIEFLKHEKIKELIDSKGKNSSTSKENVWETVLAIADRGCLTRTELEDILEASRSTVNRCTKALMKEPKVITGNNKTYELNVENAKEIIEKYEEKKETKQQIESLKEEVGIE